MQSCRSLHSLNLCQWLKNSPKTRDQVRSCDNILNNMAEDTKSKLTIRPTNHSAQVTNDSIHDSAQITNDSAHMTRLGSHS